MDNSSLNSFQPESNKQQFVEHGENMEQVRAHGGVHDLAKPYIALSTAVEDCRFHLV